MSLKALVIIYCFHFKLKTKSLDSFVKNVLFCITHLEVCFCTNTLDSYSVTKQTNSKNKFNNE